MSTAAEHRSALEEFLDDVETPPDYFDEPAPYFEGEGLAVLGSDQRLHRPPWSIQDDGAADWALRKLAKVLAAKADVDQQAKDGMQRVQTWHMAVRGPIDHDEKRWRALLEDYALRRREKTGALSVKLPNGELTTRVQDKGGTIEIADEKVLAAWIKLHPEFEAWCKLEPEPQVGRLKNDVEIIDGALCRHCGEPIVFEKQRWVSGLLGPVCDKSGYNGRDNIGHQPVMDPGPESFELVLRVVQVAVVQGLRFPVPGLGVRPETVKPQAKT